MEQRTCPVCREPFTLKAPNQRFCSRQHSKAYQNATKRGSLDALLARGGVASPFDCAQCGRACVPGEDGVASHARKFCKQGCKIGWHKKRELRRSRRRNAARAKAKRSMRPGPSRRWIVGVCFGCNENFTAPRAASWDRHYCTKTCGNRHRRAERRARKKLAWVEEVRRPVVYERDGWVCQVCGDPVNPETKWPDNMCASLDHIVPLVEGGAHSYENTQLAHHLCNSLKGTATSDWKILAA